MPGYSGPSRAPRLGCRDPIPELPNPVLAPYDLTRGGSYYKYMGHTDVKELALYAEDQIKAGNWLFNLGLRGDIYNGLAEAQQAEPRVGIAYNIKPTTTVLRVSYARTLETPFNENLVLSSNGCSNAVLSPLLNCTSGVIRNTRSRLTATSFMPACSRPSGNMPLSAASTYGSTRTTPSTSAYWVTRLSTFPIDWHNSKIPGYALRADVPEIHNFSAYFVASSVAARFFPPQSRRSRSRPPDRRPAVSH